MRVLFCVAVIFASISGLANEASAQSARGHYIKFDLNDCTTIDRDEESGSIIQKCTGADGYAFFVAEGDLRFFVGYGPDGRNQRAFSQTLGPFNSIHNVMELRYNRSKKQPHASILRYFTEGIVDQRTGKRQRGQVLVVTRITANNACHMAYIDALANKDANEIAREAADSGEGFDCSKDEPATVGKRGVSPF